ncbi:MAG: ATP-binding protein [Gemmatimonadota bacterium]
MMEENPTAFEGEITVASRIVDQLSSGLYESPAACLKELINNSFDADARHVRVLIKPDADRIIIEDDGHGMNKKDFVRHFTKISESYKREDGDRTASGRKKIGKIGIGFIAANEICDTMEILATKTGSTELLHVEIAFDRMREDPATRRRANSAVAKGDFRGEVLTASKNDHYTQVILKRVRVNAQKLFAGETNVMQDETPRTLYGLRAESVLKALADPTLTSWSEFDTYSQNLLKVALNVPVAYPDGWVPSHISKAVRPFMEAVAKQGFEVSYDGTPLRKPIVLRVVPERKCLVSRFDFKGEHVGATGYFYAQHGVVRPQELHGLLLRIRHAAVGEYDPSFLGFSPSEGSLIQRWISAEVYADDRLEDALNIDRKTLRVAHPAYLELQAAIHAHLTKVIGRARADLYDVGSEERKAVKTGDAVADIRAIATVAGKSVGVATANKLVATWSGASRDSHLSKALLRKFSVVELYRLVLDVATDTLPPELVAKFVRKLTERLSK